MSMTKRQRPMTRFCAGSDAAPPRPDFFAGLKEIYKKTLKVMGTDSVSSVRDRFCAYRLTPVLV
jgi:hypothetical protein